MAVRKRRTLLAVLLIALGFTTIGAICWYAWTARRYWFNRPRIQRNFAAEINERALQVPESQRAWPHYREAMLMFQPPESPWEASEFHPSSPDWQKSAAYLHQHQSALANLRQASKFEHLGQILQDAVSPEDAPLSDGDTNHPPSENPLLLAVYLFSTQQLAKFAPLLVGDAYLAAQNGDGERAMANLEALARAAKHAGTPPMPVTRMAAIDMFVLAFSVAGDLLSDYSSVLTDEHLMRLENLTAKLEAGNIDSYLTSDRLMFLDLLQRLYTDDGNGDGYPYLPAYRKQIGNEEPSAWEQFVAPLIAGRLGTRRETLAAYDKVMNRAQQEFALPPWRLTDWTVEKGMKPYMNDPRFTLLVNMFPNVEGVYFQEQLIVQLRDAMRAAVAMVRWRRKHQKWPSELSELVPEMLPDIPLDRIDGKPLRYRIVESEAILYSIGFDRDDDKGSSSLSTLDKLSGPFPRTSAYTANWRKMVRGSGQFPSGDWLLWRSAAH